MIRLRVVAFFLLYMKGKPILLYNTKKELFTVHFHTSCKNIKGDKRKKVGFWLIYIDGMGLPLPGVTENGNLR